MLLIEVDIAPKIFAGSQNNQVIGKVPSGRVTRYNRRIQEDITQGEIYRCPYHRVSSSNKCSNGNNVLLAQEEEDIILEQTFD